MSVKPITPAEVSAEFAKRPLIPDFVLEAVNDLLCRKCRDPKCTIKLQETNIIAEISKRDPYGDCDTTQDYKEHLHDTVSLYEEAGWDVKYVAEHTPGGYNTSYFAFTPITKP